MDRKGLRILYMANAPWCGTGYGVQSNSLIPRLMRLDSVEDIALFAYWGIQGGITRQTIGNEFAGEVEVTCFPVLGDMWGNDAVCEHVRQFEADCVITLMDIWVLDMQRFGFSGFAWLPWMPIDHEPVPPPVLQRCRHAYLPLTYSRSAQAELDRVGVENVYIPHGVETRLFRPLAADRGDCKEMLGFDRDCFLIGCVGANKGYPDRKGFGWLFEAFRRFRERHGEAQLYVHTMPSRQHGGPDLNAWATAAGVSDAVRFMTPYRAFVGFEPELLVQTYNAFDVLALPTMGEGFGIPLVEAQACGVPVIATDFAASAELVEDPDWRIPVAARQMTNLGSWQAIPDVVVLTELLERAHDSAGDPARRQRARDFAMQYDWDSLVEKHWRPFMDELAETITPKTMRREVEVVL